MTVGKDPVPGSPLSGGEFLGLRSRVSAVGSQVREFRYRYGCRYELENMTEGKYPVPGFPLSGGCTFGWRVPLMGSDTFSIPDEVRPRVQNGRLG